MIKLALATLSGRKEIKVATCTTGIALVRSSSLVETVISVSLATGACQKIEMAVNLVTVTWAGPMITIATSLLGSVGKINLANFGMSVVLNCMQYVCSCRPNLTGRNCSTPQQGYFAPSMDHFLYEAEAARTSPVSLANDSNR